MFLNCLQCILRAGWFKAATGPDEWGNPILVDLNEFYQNPIHYSLIDWIMPIFFNI